MRKLLTGAVALGLASLTLPALAADKAGPVVVSEPTLAVASSDRTPWTGCYIEAGAGRDIVVNKDSLGLGSVQGTVLSLGAGCDLQVREHIVIGALARYGFAFDNASEAAGFKVRAERPWMAGIRAGVLMNTSTLVYGILGVNGLVFKASDAASSVSDSSKNLTLGAGIESQILGRRWTIGLEYLWSSIDSDLHETKVDAHSVRASVRHRF